MSLTLIQKVEIKEVFVTKRSIILLSGGLDSAVNLAYCSKKDLPVLALTIDYGQRAVKNEIHAAKKFAQYFNVEHQVVDLRWLGNISQSALNNTHLNIPQFTEDSLDHKVTTQNSAKQVWVSNRNGLFVQVAAAFAESYNAEQVVVGFNLEEAQTFPDNSTQFIEAVNHALSFSTLNGVKLNCYTDRLIKKEMVEQLLKLHPSFPFQWVWSCYQAGDKHCNLCESCLRFNRALKVKDSLEVGLC